MLSLACNELLEKKFSKLYSPRDIFNEPKKSDYGLETKQFLANHTYIVSERNRLTLSDRVHACRSHACLRCLSEKIVLR